MAAGRFREALEQDRTMPWTLIIASPERLVSSEGFGFSHDSLILYSLVPSLSEPLTR